MFNLNWQPGLTLSHLEKEAILAAFRFFRGNKTATARSLDISVRTLETKLEKYQEDGKDQEDANERLKQERDDFRLRQRGFITDTDGKIIPLSGVASGGDIPPKRSTNGNGADSGLHMEPVTKASEKHEVPVSVGQKVQSVPLRNAPESNQRKGR